MINANRTVFEIEVHYGSIDQKGYTVDSYDYEQYANYQEAEEVYNNISPTTGEYYALVENTYDAEDDLIDSSTLLHTF